MGAITKGGSVDTIEWGGRSIPLKPGHKILSGFANTSTNVRCTLRESGSSSGYAPGANGAKVIGFRIRGTGQTGTAILVSAGLQTSSNDVGQSASTALSSPTPVDASGTLGVCYNAAQSSPGADYSAAKHYANGVTLSSGRYLSATVQGTASTDVIVEALIEEL